MTMQLETRSREAFELVTEALGFIDQYRESRNVARLTDASIRLTEASQRDPHYFRARYYDAIVDDLLGHFGSASKKLTELLDQSPPLADEVRYNLGLAEYHGYSHSALERAITQFRLVLKSVKDPSLCLRAQAGLAQAYAMHMIPQEYDRPDLQQINEYYNLAFGCVSRVLKEADFSWHRWLNLFRKFSMSRPVAAEVRWTALNAKGMALMYYADYLPQIEQISGEPARERQVAIAQAAFLDLCRAETIQAGDWANQCDIASAQMRLAYFKREQQRYDKALDILRDVIERLRPGYAFAIYERGRVLRLKGEFVSAIQSFNVASQIPEEQRDVSDRRISTERRRAETEDRTFP